MELKSKVELLGALVCMLLSAGCASPDRARATPTSEASSQPSVQELALGNPGTFGFLLPPAWIYQPGKLTSPLLPGSFRVDAPDQSTAVQVTVSWDGLGPKPSSPTLAELELKLRVQAGYQHIRTSVEKKVITKPVQGTRMTGFYAQFTEEQWTNAEVPLGVYPVVTEGVFRCENLWGTFTIYSQDKTGTAFNHAFAMVRSFRKL